MIIYWDDIQFWDGMLSSSADTTPPEDVTRFAAQAGDSEIDLSWKNPSDSVLRVR